MTRVAATSPVTALTLAARTREAVMLIVLLSSGPFMALMFVVVAPVLSSLAAHFGHGRDGALIAQMIMTLPSIGVILGGPATGWLVERAGIRYTMFLSLFAYSVAGSLGMAIDHLWLMFAMRFLLGSSAAGIATSTMAFIGQYYRDDTRQRILGYQSAAGAGSGLLALLAAGGMGEAAGWRAPFALYLLGAVVLMMALYSVPRAAPLAPQAKQGFAGLLPLWPVYLLIVLVFSAIFMSAVQLAFLLADEGITSPAVQSWVLATSSACSAAGAWAYGHVRPRLGSYGTFALCLGLLSGGLAAIGFGHGAVAAAVGSAIAGLGSGAAGPYVAGTLLDRAPAEVRGRAVGFMYTAIYLGDFANPLIVTPVRAWFGIHGAFIAVSAALAAGAIWATGRHILVSRPRVSS